nr:immunoglobulin light chain junction region [Macaca mulatta]MOV67361.1 immunoglobulin light chain junction region [Macaca mulatta]MOV67595.1 immunoglobulin light chain junction region [Macaca mulatta]MOV67776.1 immunoglobulin light chain junction region [Macaca mulatta]MOV70630.1 immunoglobulin light chain junction region [Macaca mulatta]
DYYCQVWDNSNKYAIF